MNNKHLKVSVGQQFRSSLELGARGILVQGLWWGCSQDIGWGYNQLRLAWGRRIHCHDGSPTWLLAEGLSSSLPFYGYLSSSLHGSLHRQPEYLHNMADNFPPDQVKRQTDRKAVIGHRFHFLISEIVHCHFNFNSIWWK